MRIYLVRHGVAKSKEQDPQRRLTDRGAHDAQKIAAFLEPLHLNVKAIWHSGKPRAAQTAEILVEAVSTEDGMIERSGMAPNDPVLPMIKSAIGAGGDVVLVGHLPFLGKFASALVTRNDDADLIAFEPATVVCLEDDTANNWRIAWTITPDILQG